MRRFFASIRLAVEYQVSFRVSGFARESTRLVRLRKECRPK